MSFNNLTTTWAPRGLSVLRIMSAMLFMEHGTLKILGFPDSGDFVANWHQWSY